MNLVAVEGVSKRLAERLIFDDVNLRINAGDRIGLIGVNGSGKTTLLRMIAGLERPDEGSIAIAGGIAIGYLPQEPHLDQQIDVLEQLFRSDDPAMRLLCDFRRATAALEREPGKKSAQQDLVAISSEMDRTGSWMAETRAKTILTKLGIHDFGSVTGSLSGGEQKRVALARALLEPVDLLALDEPTNHVDADTIAWLEEYLDTTSEALLLVTHDRYFLDRIVNRIVELDRRGLTSYPGSYRRYVELRSARHERLSKAEEERKKVLGRELEWLRRAPKARTTKQKARRDRIEELRRIAYDRGEERVSMALAGRRLGNKVMAAKGLVKAYGELRLFDGLDLVLEPGERIGIIGPNGSGKTTFLDILAGRVAPDAGSVEWGTTAKLGYFDQMGSALDESSTVLQLIEDEAPLVLSSDGARVSAARMLEWFLFDRRAQRAQVGSLSGGERRRLQLLAILVGRPNVLFLDEPTNDLDIPTLSVLEDFLDHFPGSLLVASHDRYFLDRTVDQLVFFEDGRFGTRYPAPFETYQRLRQEAERSRAETDELPRKPKPVAPDRTASGASGRQKPSGGLTWKEERELERAETRLAGLDARRGEVLAEIERTGSDYVRLQELADELASIDRESDEVMERWMTLSEKKEAS